MGIFPSGWGEYPPEYNREIHGPYNPSMYYGKRDIPFGDVKLKDLFSWFGRRKKTPRAMAQAISRTWFKYNLKWIAPKKPGPYFLYHFCAVTIIFHYIIEHKKFQSMQWYRYH